MSDTATPRALLFVTTPEGTEFVPETAFAAAASRSMGLVPRLVATDFCTTKDGFQNIVSAPDVFGVVFFDAPEFREVVDGLSRIALDSGVKRVVVMGDGREDEGAPSTFDPRVETAFENDAAALAEALGLPAPPGLALETTPLDYGVFGGGALLDRAVGCSLYGDLGVAALVAVRAPRSLSSPCAALARLEGAVKGSRRVPLRPDVAHAPLDLLGANVRNVEWLDRDFFEATLMRPPWPGVDAADRAYLEPVRERGLPQSVRIGAKTPGPMMETLRELGVARVDFDCDALQDVERLPGAGATAEDVLAAAEVARNVGLRVGVLISVGLPGETPERTRERCDVLRAAGCDRARAIPFEPTGGKASAWCRARDLWPPVRDRWNREIFQPLRGPGLGKDSFVRSFEAALTFVAETQVACARGGAVGKTA